jgi:hypothetical protein
MNNDKITIKYENNSKKIELELPANIKLLRHTLNTLGYKKNISKRKTTYPASKLPSKISYDLYENKKFQKLFPLLNKKFIEWHYLRTDIENIRYLEEKPNQDHDRISLDQWKKRCYTAFEKVHKKNIQFIIIHILGAISLDEQKFLVESIYHQLQPIPITTFHTDVRSSVTLVEVILFGEDLLKVEDE